MPVAESAKFNARIAFTYPGFTIFQIARFCIVLATEMQSVAVGWQIYEITHNTFDLGLVGLVQFLPGILLFLVSGQAADRYNRRTVLMVSYAGFAVCSSLLLSLSLRTIHTVFPIYVVLVLVGVVRSFTAPSSRAILPLIIPEEHLQSAISWNASIMQAGTILGPAAGGLAYAFFDRLDHRGPTAVYTMAMTAAIGAAVSMYRVRLTNKPRPRERITSKTVLAGLHYIWRQKLVLGSISLDLFAVLLGGAVALLPAYARDILKTGPWGLGLLRCAPAIGATTMALILAHWPLRKKAGPTMLWCVAGFGIATIIFGISHNLVISLIALIFVGATDMVSVVVRALLVQVATPDEMRGRVNAVDMIFIGTSNELGAFESGTTARLFGTVPAVILGGIGTLLVTVFWAWLFPELRNVDDPKLGQS